MKTPKQHLLSLAFAVVFLPPRKEVEDWSSAFPPKDIPKESFVEKVPLASSSSLSLAKEVSYSSRFSFNGVDKVGFAAGRGEKLQWEVSLPPVDYYKVWESGAWTGLSLTAREWHHFYIRQQKRGPEPKYRTYVLAPDWELIDFNFCSKRDVLFLEKAVKADETKKIPYRITRVKLLTSQELKREASWRFEAEAGHEFLSLKSNTVENCTAVELEGWPKSFRVKL